VLLAGRYRPGIDLRDWWVSEKYDGVRGYWDGRTLRTRGGDAVPAPAWFTAGWPATPMDGELWAGRGRFEQVQSTVARQQADDAAWHALRYMVFDLPAHSGSFDERLAAVNGVVARIDRPWVQAVAQRKLASDAQLQALLRQVVRGGGEGLMLHRGASLYRAGRGDDLLKLKPHDDAEARVVAHLPGQGRHAGQLGALLVETPEGRRFALGSGLTDAERRQPPPVGAWVTYRYRGLHQGSALPRFASFVRVRLDAPR
jgi:DNA ligase-1